MFKINLRFGFAVALFLAVFGGVTQAADLPVRFDPTTYTAEGTPAYTTCGSGNHYAPAVQVPQQMFPTTPVKVQSCISDQSVEVIALYGIPGQRKGIAIVHNSIFPKGCWVIKMWNIPGNWVLASAGILRKDGSWSSSANDATVGRGAFVAIEETPGACRGTTVSYKSWTMNMIIVDAQSAINHAFANLRQ